MFSRTMRCLVGLGNKNGSDVTAPPTKEKTIRYDVDGARIETRLFCLIVFLI